MRITGFGTCTWRLIGDIKKMVNDGAQVIFWSHYYMMI